MLLASEQKCGHLNASTHACYNIRSKSFFYLDLVLKLAPDLLNFAPILTGHNFLDLALHETADAGEILGMVGIINQK